MKLTNFALIAACSLFTLACKAETGEGGKMDTGIPKSGGASAFEKYLGKPADLLTEAQAAEICGNPANAEFELTELPGKMAKYSKVEYQWDSGRMQKIKAGNMEMNVPRPFLLSVSLPMEVKARGEDQTVIQAFDQAHKTMTAEQAEAAKKAMSAAFNKTAEEKGIGENEKAVGQGLGGSIIEQAMSTTYEKIDGLGDAAYWESKERKLDVLSGSLQISIVADVAEADAESKKAAVKVANLLLK